jgi:hypothetical protein
VNANAKPNIKKEKLQAGDSQAAAGLWQRYFDRLVEVARGKLRHAPRRAADEEDVALSAFDSLCRGVAAGRFPHPSGPLAGPHKHMSKRRRDRPDFRGVARKELRAGPNPHPLVRARASMSRLLAMAGSPLVRVMVCPARLESKLAVSPPSSWAR